MTHKISWHRTGGTATQPADQSYPKGIDLTCAPPDYKGAVCNVKIPYPAAGIGHWIITCLDCGLTVACTAAGRKDDPRLMQMPCKARKL